jgi:tRNA pseudouridine38-40 synthase
MVRVVRLDLAYDGTGFHGWARQRDRGIRTVEGLVRSELGRVLGAEPRLSVAGRTDAGAHARGQVASFRTDSEVPPESLLASVNGRLAPEVVVRRARYAPEGFDARFSATAREYRYEIDTEELPDPFTARFSWHRPSDVSLGRMRAAAARFIGVHDFRSFCKHPGAGRSTVRDLQRLTVARIGEHVVLRVRANAFLHQMVRSIVGTLVAVGEAKITPESVSEILAARDRAAAAPVAPPHGLMLERVIYGARANTPGIDGHRCRAYPSARRT